MTGYKDLFSFIFQIALFFLLVFVSIIGIQYFFHFLGLVYDWALAPINGGFFPSEVKP